LINTSKQGGKETGPIVIARARDIELDTYEQYRASAYPESGKKKIFRGRGGASRDIEGVSKEQ